VGVMNLGLASAAGNSGKPSPPGQEKTPPGQAKAEGKPDKSTPPGQLDKGTTAPAPSASERAQAEHGQAASDDVAPSSHPKPRHASKSSEDPSSHPKPKHVATPTAVRDAAKAEKTQPARGNSAVAHAHVIICHRTGSTSNPYVVINISMSAWLHGHSTHPERNGHNDILLKQGAAPGEKMPRSACGNPRPPHTPVPPVVNTTPTPTPVTPSAPPKGKPADPPAPAGPVVPPAPPKGRPGSADEGVAAHVEAAVRQELPFTGVPLWIAVFAGSLLLAGGVAIRKASWAPDEAEADRVRPSRRR
jgi:hypothetical protein